MSVQYHLCDHLWFTNNHGWASRQQKQLGCTGIWTYNLPIISTKALLMCNQLLACCCSCYGCHHSMSFFPDHRRQQERLWHSAEGPGASDHRPLCAIHAHHWSHCICVYEGGAVWMRVARSAFIITSSATCIPKGNFHPENIWNMFRLKVEGLEPVTDWTDESTKALLHR